MALVLVNNANITQAFLYPRQSFFYHTASYDKLSLLSINFREKIILVSARPNMTYFYKGKNRTVVFFFHKWNLVTLETTV